MIRYAFLLIISGLLISCSNDEVIHPERVPQLSLVANSQIIEEGEIATVSFNLSERIDREITFQLERAGSAIMGEDYEDFSTIVSIPAQHLSSQILISTNSDLLDEGDETIILTVLSNNIEQQSTERLSITIEVLDGPTAKDIISFAQRELMSNPNATEETVALFYNLKEVAKTSFLVGQQNAFSSFYMNNAGDSDIKKATGSDPALLGSDFMFITDDENDETTNNWYYQQEQQIKQDVINAYNKGMVNIFAWHFREPYEGKHFYTSEMTDFQKENAFRSILPGGENHDYYKAKLRKIAEVIKSLSGDNGELIPVIFRPFHEFDGNWFWWGQAYCTPQEFINCWRFTVNFLLNDQNVKNVLFAYSPDNLFFDEASYLQRYPGDQYVDVLGMDNYSDFQMGHQMDMSKANQKLKIISDLAKAKGKVAALTETCYFIEPGVTSALPNFYSGHLYESMTSNDVELSFMMFWYNTRTRYCTPPPGLDGYQDFMDFIGKPETLLTDELINLYTINIDSQS